MKVYTNSCKKLTYKNIFIGISLFNFLNINFLLIIAIYLDHIEVYELMKCTNCMDVSRPFYKRLLLKLYNININY